LMWLVVAGVASARPGDFDPAYQTGSRTFSSDYSGMMALDDGRLLISAFATVPFDTLKPVVVALRSDGQSDLAFGEAGRLVLSVPSGSRFSNPAASTLDGKLLVTAVAGEYNEVLRLNQDGTLDPDFGVGGQLVLGEKASIFPARDGYVAYLTVRPDGRLHILEFPMDCVDFWEVGCTRLEAAAIVRQFMPDGTPDESFGAGGRAEIPAFAGGTGTSFGLRQDGALVMLGEDGEHRVIAADGRSIQSAATGVRAQTGALWPDGSLLLATYSLDGRRLEVVRLLPDGTLDPDFGGGTGRSIVAPGLRLSVSPTSSNITGIRQSRDGRFIYLGITLGQYTDDLPYVDAFALVRLTGSGELDKTFGSDGLRRLPHLSGWSNFVLDRTDRPLVLAQGQVIRLLTDDSPSPGLFEVRSENRPASVPESAGTVRVRVSRFAGRSGAISARVVARTTFEANPRLAIEGQDFLLRTTRLDWADGDESDKPILIDILDDKDMESSEFLALDISADSSGTRVFQPGGHPYVTVGIEESDMPGSTGSSTAPSLATAEGGGGASAPEGLLLLFLWTAMHARRRLRC
jgi:uncharacterized delta-60 repeat protein